MTADFVRSGNAIRINMSGQAGHTIHSQGFYPGMQSLLGYLTSATFSRNITQPAFSATTYTPLATLSATQIASCVPAGFTPFASLVTSRPDRSYTVSDTFSAVGSE